MGPRRCPDRGGGTLSPLRHAVQTRTCPYQPQADAVLRSGTQVLRRENAFEYFTTWGCFRSGRGGGRGARPEAKEEEEVPEAEFL